MENAIWSSDGVKIIHADKASIKEALDTKDVWCRFRDQVLRKASIEEWNDFLTGDLKEIISKVNGITMSSGCFCTLDADTFCKVLDMKGYSTRVSISEGHNDPGYGTMDVIQGKGFSLHRINSRKWELRI